MAVKDWEPYLHPEKAMKKFKAEVDPELELERLIIDELVDSMKADMSGPPYMTTIVSSPAKYIKIDFSIIPTIGEDNGSS